MSADCCLVPEDKEARITVSAGVQRRVLWIALIVNAGMFLVELLAGNHARSSAIQADALDFLADSANYAISLFVIAASVPSRATAALVKGASMGLFGTWVLGHTAYRIIEGTVPTAGVMGMVGVLALIANLGVLVLLLAFRRGDSNMRSVWICTRNDVLGNTAVLVAAGAVAATNSLWPDVAVAFAMAALGLSGAWQIVSQARGELNRARQTGSSPAKNPPELHLHSQ